MKETNHDYQSCIVGNAYDSNMTGTYSSWQEFKNTHTAFTPTGFDDTYHFVFRYDVHKQSDENYRLELCMMLQRKGIYVRLLIENISQDTLDTEVSEWLIDRSKYLKSLWTEVMS